MIKRSREFQILTRFQISLPTFRIETTYSHEIENGSYSYVRAKLHGKFDIAFLHLSLKSIQLKILILRIL